MMHRLVSAVFVLLLSSLAGARQQPAGSRGQGGPGEFHGELRDKQGVMMRVHMLAPSRMPPLRMLALLLVHHGMNGNEDNYYGGTIECLRRLKLEDQYVVIAGKSKAGGWTLEDDGPLTKRVIEWAKETYPIDPRRIYIWGSSNGAGYIGRFGWANPDLVAAAIGYCGGYNFQAKEKPSVDTYPEWYFVHGGNDNPQNSGNACKQLQALGIRAVFRQLDGYGHTDIWDGNGHPDKTVVDEVRDDYVLWLQGLRHKTMDPLPKDKEHLAAYETPSRADSLLGSKATYLNLQRIGGPQAGAAILLGLQSKSAGARASAAEACMTASFGKAVAEELAKRVDDESDRVAQAALRALGAYAVWHYPEAIEALCRVARGQGEGKGPSTVERLIAVEGLLKASRLAALGNFEDKKMWWTLVQLLDDEEVKVRALAFTALQRAVKDGHGYQPGAIPTARQAAVAKWQAWCTQKCGEAPK